MGDWADDCERRADFAEEEALAFLAEVNRRRDAVIEAAKAVNKYWKTSAPEKLEALFRAVEALELAEKGE
jgi:hypothetical protein